MAIAMKQSQTSHANGHGPLAGAPASK